MTASRHLWCAGALPAPATMRCVALLPWHSALVYHVFFYRGDAKHFTSKAYILFAGCFTHAFAKSEAAIRLSNRIDIASAQKALLPASCNKLISLPTHSSHLASHLFRSKVALHSCGKSSCSRSQSEASAPAAGRSPEESSKAANSSWKRYSEIVVAMISTL